MIELTDKELIWEIIKYLRTFLDRGSISHEEFDKITLLGLYHNSCWDWSSSSIQSLLQEIIDANHSDGTVNDL